MAISHIFTNPVPDGTITSIVRPSDWNSAHNQYYTLSGNVLGASTVSGTNVVLQAGTNISLSGTGQTIVIQGTNTPQPTAYVSSVNGSSGAISLAAGSSLSASTNGSSITFGLASNITTALQSAGNYLTTQTVQTQASGNIAGTGFTSTTTAGSAVTGALGTNGISLAIPAYLTTARASNDGVGLNTAQTNVTWTVNSNGISLNAGAYLTTQTVQTQASGNIVGSGFTSTTTAGTAVVGTQNSQGLSLAIPAYLTTQSVQTQASGNIARTGFTSTTTAGTAIVGTLNTGGLSLGVPAFITAGGGGGNFSGGVSNLGNTAGSTGITGTRIVFVGTNNISLSQSTDANGATISINQTGGGGGGGVAIAGGTQTATSGTVNFANSNGITFGMSDSNQITASYTVPTVPTSYVSNVNGSSGQISLNVGSSLSSSTNGSSITFGLASNITTALQSANANYLTSQSNQAFSASGGSSTFQTLNFANSNGVTFSNSGGSIVASYTVPTVPTSYVSNVNGSSGQISLNVGSSLSSSTNGSSITFGLASNITTALQSAGAYLTTARASNDAIGLNTAATNVTWTVNSSGISLNAAGYAGTGFTSTTTAGTEVKGTLATNGLSLAVPAFITAGGGGGNFSGGVSNLGNTAGSTGITGTRIVFVGTNNISLSQSTDANGATISINQTGGGGGGAMYANLSGATSGNTTASGSTLNFSGINVTLSGTNASQIAISAPATTALVAGNNISLSANANTLSVLAQAVAVSAGSQLATSGTLLFSDANGFTFGMSGSSRITVSARSAFSAAGGSSTISTLNFTASNGVTFTNTNGSIAVVHDLQFTSNTSNITTNAFPSADTTKFAGTGTTAVNATVTLNSNGINISVAAPGAANYSIGVSNLGNTAGSTGITGTRIVFVGTNNISLSQSTDANGATISFDQTGGGGGGLTNINVSAGTTSNNLSNIVFSNTNGVTFGLNGSTVTASVAAAGGVIASGYSPHGDYPLVVGEMGQGTLALDPDIFPDLTMNQIAIPINFSHATNSTGSFTLSNWIGLYSRNASSISLAHSTSFSTGITFSGTANSVSHVGMRLLTYPWSTSVSGGRYWIAQIMRTTTGGANCSFSQYLASQINSSFLGPFGIATNATYQFTLGQGLYSTSTTALPNNIPYSQIRGAGSTTGSLGLRFPIVQFGFNSV